MRSPSVTNFLVALSLILPTTICAQQIGPGIAPFGSYSSKDVYSIDNTTGNLHVAIPLASYPQAGSLPPITYSVQSDNPQFLQAETCDSYWDICYVYLDKDASLLTGAMGGAAIEVTPGFGGLVSFVNQDNNYYTWCYGGADGGCDGLGGSGVEYAQVQYYIVDDTGYYHGMYFDAEDTSILHSSDGMGFTAKFPEGSNTYDALSFTNLVGLDSATVSNPSGIQHTQSSTYGDVWEKWSDPEGHTLTLQNGVYTDSMQRTFPQSGPPASTAACPNLGHPEQPVTGAYTLSLPSTSGKTLNLLICGTAFWYHNNSVTNDEYLTYSQSYPNPSYWTDGLTTPPDTTQIIPVDTYGTMSAVQSVVLPTGDAWCFLYDAGTLTPDGDDDFTVTPSMGNLTEILYPTGGSASFQYQPLSTFGTDFGNPYYDGSVLYQAVTQITRNDGTRNLAAESYTYTPTTYTSASISDAPQLTTVHTDSDGNAQKHVFTTFINNGVVPLTETEEDDYKGQVDGILERTIRHSYQAVPTLNPNNYANVPLGGVLPSLDEVDEDGVVVSQTSYTYAPLYTGKNIGCIFGAGGGDCSIDPGATTQTFALDNTSIPIAFARVSSNTITPVGGQTYTLQKTPLYTVLPQYLTANILDPVSSITWASSCPSAAGQTCSGIVAETSYLYDEAQYSSGSTFGLNTSTSQWLNTTASSLVSHKYYNSDGLVIASVDPMGIITQVNSFQCNGLFPYSISRAAGTSITETTTETKDCTNGKTTQTTDANGIASTYDYNDPLDRIHQIRQAINTSAENWTSYFYPSLHETDITRDEAVKGDGLLSGFNRVDGLGRLIASSPLPGGSVTGYSYYDTDRIMKQSLPYNVGSIANQWTSFLYDGLGRKVEQIDSDNESILWWCYNGVMVSNQPNCHSSSSGNAGWWVDQSDENGNNTQITYSGNNAIVAVVEPGNLKTQYGYDLLGNPVSITQIGANGETARTRVFRYDSLSRLLSAQNPETGTSPGAAVCYGMGDGTLSGCRADGYDGDGNLLYKTDARGITLHYLYDAMNRLTAKQYLGDSGTTPSSCYQYDSPTTTYGIGRLSAEWTTSGQCSVVAPASGYQSLRLFLAYDAVGRAQNEIQCLFLSCTAAVSIAPPTASCSNPPTPPYYLTYCYNLAGDVVYSSNGLPSVPGLGSPLGFTNSYDTAGRLSSVTSTWSDFLHPPNLFTVSPANGYTPSGALQNWMLGPNVNLTGTYDNRLRVKSMTANQQ